ncbi:hypothetical protein FHG87_022432 [Trinorchestia longiramus]|nr:hypothetical protein FHG87_022432 [Trinorchestia longiramus]
MVRVTANALKQQVMNREERRLEREIKEVLEEVGCDREKIAELLVGRRVLLAEELKRSPPPPADLATFPGGIVR